MPDCNNTNCNECPQLEDGCPGPVDNLGPEDMVWNWDYERCLQVLSKKQVNKIDRSIAGASTEWLRDINRYARSLCQTHNSPDPEVHYIWITSGMELQYRDYMDWLHSQS